jgi:hypothetical protein
LTEKLLASQEWLCSMQVVYAKSPKKNISMKNVESVPISKQIAIAHSSTPSEPLSESEITDLLE